MGLSKILILRELDIKVLIAKDLFALDCVFKEPD